MVKVTIEESAIKKTAAAKVTDDCQKGIRDKSDLTSASAASLYHYIQTRKRTAEEDTTVFPGYSSKTLISNWFVPLSSFPKDYDAYNPPGGSGIRSSYNRWGDSDQKMTTESSSAQANCILEKKKPAPRKNPPLFNLVTLSTVNMEDFLTEDSELLTGKPRKYIDIYTTTMQKDYINYFPQQPQFIDRAQAYKPVTKHRNVLTELAHPRRPGRNKFFDENVDYLNKRQKEPRPLPPWALHYDPRKCKEEEVHVKKQEGTKQNSKEICETCH